MRFVLDDSPGFIINRTNLKLSNYLTRKFKPYEITPEQWGVLNRLWFKDGISQKELSELTIKDQTTTTRILDKLEWKGLIKRQRSTLDRRLLLIYLTAEGRSLEDKLVPIVKGVLNEALKGFTPEEIQLIKSLLNRIYNNVGK